MKDKKIGALRSPSLHPLPISLLFGRDLIKKESVTVTATQTVTGKEGGKFHK